MSTEASADPVPGETVETPPKAEGETPAPVEPGKEAETKPDSAEKEEVAPVPELPAPCIDMSDFKLKVDHFEEIHMLPETAELVEGVPNFRQVPGFPVYGSAQPTEVGFRNIMAKLNPETDESKVRTLWYNMRQEPVVYVNGLPHTLRDPARMHENLSLEDSVPELDTLELHAAEIVKKRVESDVDRMVSVSKDTSFTANPMERENVEDKIRADTVEGLPSIFRSLTGDRPGFATIRVPVVEEKAPKEECFDILVESLKGEPGATQCVFSCQAGQGRSTLGMIVCCLVKEVQLTTELQRMCSMGLIPPGTVEELIKTKFESELPETQYDEDPLVNGEFDVIKELLEKLPGAKQAKAKVDRTIDLCGGAPRGTGTQNLREIIIETKWKYDVAADDKQTLLKQMILNFMERYFYLICFSTYAMQEGPGGFQVSFVQWMNSHSELRPMIDEGKDKLEWTRQVDMEQLKTLRELMEVPNYQENMSMIIRTIYEFAFMAYADLPRGPIKNNSMRKLAAKTLMEILPPEVEEKVTRKLDEQSASADFLNIVGMIAYDYTAEA